MKTIRLITVLALILSAGLVAHAEDEKSFAPAYEVSNDLTNWKRIYLGYKTSKQVCEEMKGWIYYRMIDLHSGDVSSALYNRQPSFRCPKEKECK